jgi:hypothetical protein
MVIIGPMFVRPDGGAVIVVAMNCSPRSAACRRSNDRDNRMSLYSPKSATLSICARARIDV